MFDDIMCMLRNNKIVTTSCLCAGKMGKCCHVISEILGTNCLVFAS